MSILDRKVEFGPSLSNLPEGAKLEQILDREGISHPLAILDFRNPRHLNLVARALVEDENVAFHGWGVVGMGRRVDAQSNRFHEFWTLKSNRPPGSKIPLMEPPGALVDHVDWQAVHPDYRYLQDPRYLMNLWRHRLPFHVIFPYREGGDLNRVVITPARDPDVAPEIPYPTFCSFWVEDPATTGIINVIKSVDPLFQIGVSSLNQSGEHPPYNTSEALEHFRLGKIDIAKFPIMVGDSLLEPIGVNSSHSQFVIPMVEAESVWTMKRIGSISANLFERQTGFKVKIAEGAKIASRKASPEVDLDSKSQAAANAIEKWHRNSYLLNV